MFIKHHHQSPIHSSNQDATVSQKKKSTHAYIPPVPELGNSPHHHNKQSHRQNIPNPIPPDYVYKTSPSTAKIPPTVNSKTTQFHKVFNYAEFLQGPNKIPETKYLRNGWQYTNYLR